MESYLMMLYVTLDQESALKSFFIDQGWDFLKPDLSVITDKIGPVKSLSTQSPTLGQAPVSAETYTVSTVPENTVHIVTETDRLSHVSENTIHVEISGKSDPEPGSSRKRQSKSKQTKQPVAKVPNIKLKCSSTSGSDNLLGQPQSEFPVQPQAANIKPDLIDGVYGVVVKEEAVDSDYGPEYDDVDDNESTDKVERSQQVSAGNGDDNAWERQKVTEGEQYEERTNKDCAKPENMDNNFVCSICAKTYTSKRSLRLHENRHIGSRKFQCEICGSAFTCNDELSQHMARHGTEPRYTCDFCGKLFNRRSCYHQHRRVHLPEKHFQCLKCDKIFVHKQVYLAHCETHTGSKQCEKCNKYVIHLKRHLKHCGTDKIKHVCPDCGKAFKQQRYLVEHCKSFHEGTEKYMCQMCGKKYRLRSSLNYHTKKCNSLLMASS